MKASLSSQAHQSVAATSSAVEPRSLSERGEHLARKLERAERMLARVSPRSRDAQLLGIALLRRDQTLLDELLARLSRQR